MKKMFRISIITVFMTVVFISTTMGQEPQADKDTLVVSHACPGSALSQASPVLPGSFASRSMIRA